MGWSLVYADCICEEETNITMKKNGEPKELKPLLICPRCQAKITLAFNAPPIEYQKEIERLEAQVGRLRGALEKLRSTPLNSVVHAWIKEALNEGKRGSNG